MVFGTPMLYTRQTKLSWQGLALSQLPFAFWMFSLQLPNGAALFSLRKFTEEPRTLAWLCALLWLPDLLVTPLACAWSDQLWTPWGRRLPFIFAGGFLALFFALMIPAAGSATGVILLSIALRAAIGIGQVYQPLSQELVPTQQRGIASSLRSLYFALGITLFYSFVIGFFDRTFQFPLLGTAFQLKGEWLVYGLGALGYVASPLFVFFLVREKKPDADPQAPGPTPSQTRAAGLGELLRSLRNPAYLGAYGVILALNLNFDLGPFGLLLYTEQWGYSKQEMGLNVGLGMLLMIPFTFLSGWLSDRFDKLQAFRVAMGICLLSLLAYLFYVQVYLGGARPSLLQILVFNHFIYLMHWVSLTVAWPLMYEYLPEERYGTGSAGINILNALACASSTLVVGTFIQSYSQLTGHPKQDYFSGYYLSCFGLCLSLFLLSQLRSAEKRGKLQRVGKKI